MIVEIGNFTLTLAHLFVLAGGSFIVLEAAVPGSDMVVVGGALLLSGIFGAITGIGSNAVSATNIFYLSLAAFIAGIFIFIVYRKFLKNQGTGITTSDRQDLENQRGTVVETVTQDSGRVRLDDGGSNPVFSAYCKQGAIDEQTRIRVADAGGGSLLEVKPINENGTNKEPNSNESSTQEVEN